MWRWLLTRRKKDYPPERVTIEMTLPSFPLIADGSGYDMTDMTYTIGSSTTAATYSSISMTEGIGSATFAIPAGTRHVAIRTETDPLTGGMTRSMMLKLPLP